MIREMGKLIQSSTSNLVIVMKDVLGNKKETKLAESTQHAYDAIDKCEAQNLKFEEISVG